MTGEIRLVVATTNPKKIEEISRMVPSWVQLIARPNDVGDVEESAPTLEGNAYIKAVEIANFVRDWAIADDTGLFVDALGGAPGVYSSRYGGPQSNDEQNRKLLLKNMQGQEKRSARFRTVITLVHSNGEMHQLVGECEGTIADVERGEKGFGYDCIFIPNEGDGRTFAEMSATEKDVLSHRGRALAQLPGLISRIFGLPPA